MGEWPPAAHLTMPLNYSLPLEVALADGTKSMLSPLPPNPRFARLLPG